MMTSSTFVAHKKCKQSGFTMVELLTVIAIIAILAAIIFPVFSSVQENSRRSKTMTNMMRIYQATAAFELDNRRYPEFLLGPALDKDGNLAAPAGGGTAISPNAVAALLRSNKRLPVGDAAVLASARAKFHYRNSLFPEYINDIDVFGSPNNQEATTANSNAITVDAGLQPNGVVRLCTEDDNERDANFNGSNPPASTVCQVGGVSAPGSVAIALPYYKFDAFDASPMINPDYTINKKVYMPRYSRVWTPILDSASLATAQASGSATPYPGPTNETQYKRQMLFKNPGGETVLTMTTHHVPKTKALVLFLNGSTKVWDVRQVMTTAPTPVEKAAVTLSPNGN
jgi:prepilin-type N-terminal cleavage/methylation domain-containing protein